MNTIQKIVAGELLLFAGLGFIGVYGVLKTMNDRIARLERERIMEQNNRIIKGGRI